MYTLLMLAVTALTACTIAHPPVIREPIVDPLLTGLQALEPLSRKTRAKRPRYPSWLTPLDTNDPTNYKFRTGNEKDWVTTEKNPIRRLRLKGDELMAYKTGVFDNVRYSRPRTAEEIEQRDPIDLDKIYRSVRPGPYRRAEYLMKVEYARRIANRPVPMKIFPTKAPRPKPTEIFALTPFEEGYFETLKKHHTQRDPLIEIPEGSHEGGEHDVHEEEVERRPNRQNPNLSRDKTLVTGDLDKLKAGVGSDDAESTVKPQNIRVLGSEFATGTIYTFGIAAALGTAIILTILGLAFGWYILSKRAKAAADVDYPAYGVTGPTIDTSGDRKLAHSAQMYHYQHQKQQIIAMERNNVEQRNGSVSDPESEEENEEGDYTVYECPGFATTGDMEVKNPLFSEEPTPATPGKVEVVKPQLKE